MRMDTHFFMLPKSSFITCIILLKYSASSANWRFDSANLRLLETQFELLVISIALTMPSQFVGSHRYSLAKIISCFKSGIHYLSSYFQKSGGKWYRENSRHIWDYKRRLYIDKSKLSLHPTILFVSNISFRISLITSKEGFE